MPLSAAPAASASSPHAAVVQIWAARWLASSRTPSSGVGGGELREEVGLVDLLDRGAADAGVAVGSSDLDQGGSVLRGGQGPNGLEAHADVAVAVLGAKKISEPHG